MTFQQTRLFLLFFSILITGCGHSKSSPAHPPTETDTYCRPSSPAPKLSKREIERDKIFTLLAFAVAEKDWQIRKKGRRGHNIAGILVDRYDRVRCWSRNAAHITRDATQHAEVRLITNFLKQSRHPNFYQHRIYVTLEPCAMCAGMIALTGIDTVVFGQPAEPSGQVFERLYLDSQKTGGYCPYPYHVQVRQAPLSIGRQLEDTKKRLKDQGKGAEINTHGSVHQIFTDAANMLRSYKVENSENKVVLHRALSFLEQVPADYTPTPYSIACKAP